jgi:2-(1,2-epoxy-1,2-dihydrophenyl)acetyl-CoA isomerase
MTASSQCLTWVAYTAAGLAPDGSSTYFLPRVVGLRRAAELMITNRRLSAEECLDWELINKVVPANQVLAEARGLARNLARGSTSAYGRVKKMLAVSFENGLESQMEVESQHIALAAASADGQEGIAAFIAKRKPAFEHC